MIRKQGRFFLLLAVLILSTACTPTGDLGYPAQPLPPDTDYPAPIEEPVESLPPDGAYPGQLDEQPPSKMEEVIEPPPATLTIDGQSQSSGIGSYCWSDQSGQALCADMLGIPTDDQPLPASTTLFAEFQLSLDELPGEVSLGIFPATDDLALPGEAGGWRWWQFGETSQFTLPAVSDPSIELTLDPGLYVFALHAMWPDRGDASYGFLVEVDGPAVPDVTAAPGEGEDPLAGEPSSESELGVVSTAITPGGRSIYLPIQPAAEDSMEALIEGQLAEVDGCLRVTNYDYMDGFLVLWPFGSDIQVSDEEIVVLNSEREIIARVDEALNLPGGAMESAETMAFFDEQIRDMPLEACPGPYWVSGPLQTLP